MLVWGIASFVLKLKSINFNVCFYFFKYYNLAISLTKLARRSPSFIKLYNLAFWKETSEIKTKTVVRGRNPCMYILVSS